MAAASGRRLRLLGDGALDRGERGLGAAGIGPDGLGVSHVGTAAALAATPPPTRTRASRRPEAEPQSKVETSLWILAANVSEIAAKKKSPAARRGSVQYPVNLQRHARCLGHDPPGQGPRPSLGAAKARLEAVRR